MKSCYEFETVVFSQAKTKMSYASLNSACFAVVAYMPFQRRSENVLHVL